MTIESYYQDVIVPALATLDAKIDELDRSDWLGAVFAKADMEGVHLETRRAFGLSIQSIWERQLRDYLLGCANELRPGEPFATKIEKANWKELQKLFRGLRGIALDSFPSFAVLDALQHLGNACRHGNGDSAVELARRYPDLWPVIPPMPPGFGVSQLAPPSRGADADSAGAPSGVRRRDREVLARRRIYLQREHRSEGPRTGSASGARAG